MKFYSFVNKRTKFGFAFILGMVSFGAFFLFLPFLSWAAPLSDSMLGYWKFDGNLEDSSGDGNVGNFYDDTPTDIATFSSIPAGFSFPNPSGINFIESGYFLVPDSLILMPANQLTFSMWLRFDAMPADGTVLGGNYNEIDPSQGFKFLVSGPNIYFKVGEAIGPSFPLADIPLGSWFHLAGTWDGSNIIIHLNGVTRSSYSYVTAGLLQGGSVFRLGNFNGAMDEVRLYNRSLNQIEISDLAASKHTSATWIGNTQIFEDPGSWSTGTIPDPYTIINIPETVFKPQLQASETVAGVNILSGASLDISNWNFSIKDGGVFSNEGELILQNTETQVIEGLVNDINSGTVRIDGTSTATSLKTGNQYYNLTVGGAGNIISQANDLIINNNLICQGGSLTLNGATTVIGDIVLNGGVFKCFLNESD